MKTVLAHGSFELLHPGHVAHLEQAKAMGDYLIVGITADAYVAKGPGRPAVPAQDRARAVRALRCVDEVVIDEHPTPERMIAFYKPDIFVKGADYVGQPLPEQEWVARYGGVVAFTTGETMYHSRQWISGSVREQLETAGLRVQDILAILDSAAAHRIHVVGDLIVDEIVEGAMIGPLTLQVGSRQRWLGGAAAVAMHAAAAGAQVSLTYPYPKGPEGYWAQGMLADSPMHCYPILVSRPHPHKARYYSDHGLLCQIDDVDSRPIPAPEIQLFAERLHTVPTDAVIFADYRHGVFHHDSIETLRAAIPDDALTVADSQVATRWGNIMDFKGFNLVTPNEREARWATGQQDAPANRLAISLQGQGNFSRVLLTRGAEGLVGLDGDDRTFIVPALAPTVVDPVGAGDALLAYATLGLLSRSSLVAAAWLGSIAAAVACNRRGNAPVTATEVRQWLEAL